MWVTANSGVPLAGNTPTSNIYNPPIRSFFCLNFNQAVQHIADEAAKAELLSALEADEDEEESL